MNWIKEYFFTSKRKVLTPLTATLLSLIPFGLLTITFLRHGMPWGAFAVVGMWFMLAIARKLTRLMEWLHHAGLFLTKTCTFIILAAFYFIVLTPFSFLWKKYFRTDKLTQSTFHLEDFKRPY